MRFSFLFLLLVSFGAGSAQRIADFTLAQSGGSVTTHFTLRAGGVCGGYRVLHSTDSVSYLEVVPHNQSCGTSGADEYYTDVHGTPVQNQYNYYKIQLFTFETSEARKIWVGNGGPQNLLVFPNPVNPLNSEVRFAIPGITAVRVQGFVRDMRGFQWSFVDQTLASDGGRLMLPELPEGVYSLWLTDGTNVYKGKFIVFH